MKIIISDLDIALAVRKNSHRCMIAEAIKREVADATIIAGGQIFEPRNMDQAFDPEEKA